MPSATTTPHGPPTHPALHLRDAYDAHVVLEAVRLGKLPLIRRRLSPCEREQLQSGNIFVWEETDDEGGLCRWTDGRRWSQSRMRGDYLYYEEKVETTTAEKEAKAARRARRASDPKATLPLPTRRRDRPAKPDGLTKQTYSVLVHNQGTGAPRKWHIVAYFSGVDYKQLPVIGGYEYLKQLRVPEGMFVSSKANGGRPERYTYYSDREEPDREMREDSLPCSVSSSPLALHSPPGLEIPSQPFLSPSIFARSIPVTKLNTYPISIPFPPLDNTPSPFSPSSSSTSTSSSTSHSPSPFYVVHSMNSKYSPPSKYVALTLEDRKALGSFRITL